MRNTCVVLLSLGVSACAGQEPKSPASLPVPAGGRSLAADEAPSASSRNSSVEGVVAVAESRPAPRMSPSNLFSFSSSAASSVVAAAQLPASGGATTERGEMIDIEARYAVQCDLVASCAAKFRELVAKHDGRITVDEGSTGKETEVTFEARVPTSKFETFAAGVSGIGAVSARDVRRRDVSKEYYDSELLLHERDAARVRYEELLKEAKNVPETLQVEAQLERLRTEIDRIKGDMRWLDDRVASATVRVKFYPSTASEDAIFAPSATLYPTLRAETMFDLRSETQRIGYVGGGFSVQFKPALRALTLDVDIARAAIADAPTGSNWSYTFLAGFDLYSEFLGGGRRKFLNPYLGFRAGYANTEGEGDFAFGGVVGVDLIKTKIVLVDVAARVLGMAGNDRGPHVAVGPTVGISFAF